MLDRRRMLIANSKGGALPRGYTALAYLESTGTQYMITDITDITATDELYIKVATTTSGRDEQNYYGFDYSNHYFDLNGRHPSQQNRVQFAWGVGVTLNTSIVATVGTTYEVTTKVESGNLNIYIDDIHQGSVSTTSYSANQKHALFGRARDSAIRLYAKAKIYAFKYWRNGDLIADFIPALDTQNTPCMYDAVSHNTYYNLGTGVFLYG